MMPAVRFGLVATIALSLTGCMGGGGSSRANPESDLPDWYRQPPSRGPHLVVGVGDGADREAARATATAEVIRQLQLSVAVDDTNVRTVSSEQSSGSPRSERVVEQARRDVRMQAAQEDLPGISESAYHQGPRRDYVMVTFDRRVWANDLNARLGELDTTLTGADQRLQAAEGGAAIGIARDLIPVLIERADLVERLHVASPGSTVAAPPIDLLTVQAILRAQVDELTLFIQLADGLEAMRPTLVEACAALALPVVNDPNAAQLRLEVSVRTRTQTVQSLIRADGSADLVLTHATSGRQLAATSLESRTSANQEALAIERLHDRMAGQLATHIDTNIVDWLAR